MPLAFARQFAKARHPWMLVCAAALIFLPRLASAQESGEAKPPFYTGDAGTAEDDTAFFGSITSSSLYYSESAQPTLVGVGPMAARADNASPIERVFTDLRLRLQADHISGGELDFKSDIRGRFQAKRCAPRNGFPCLRSQSGTLGGTEVDIREFYLRYRGPKYNIVAGRQFMPEVAAIKFDGIRYQQTADPNMQYFGFAGLYPSRGSRNLGGDYPTVLSDPANPASTPARLLPAVAGVGATYNRGRLYGSIGAAGILPRGKEVITPEKPGVLATSLVERNRFLVSSNGYWSQSETTDIYHYIVLDVAGSSGAGISNISLGVNHRPTTGVNLFAQINRVDTETLNVHAQNRLEPVNPDTPLALGNNWYVQRVAQESLRAGASSAFSQNRFQITASGNLRRRPEIDLRRNGDNGDELTLPLSQALDITINFVDRKSFERFRIGASVTRSAGFGGDNLDRSESTFGVVNATRPLLNGKGEMELNINYMQGADDRFDVDCPLAINMLLQCYGTSKNTTFGAGGMLFYRPDKNWYAMGMLSAARQSLTTEILLAEGPKKVPAITMITAFARLGYRF